MIIALLILMPLNLAAAVTPKIPSLREMCAQTILKNRIPFEHTHVAPVVHSHAQSAAHQHNEKINALPARPYFDLHINNRELIDAHEAEVLVINTLPDLPTINSSSYIMQYATKIYLHRNRIFSSIAFGSSVIIGCLCSDYSKSFDDGTPFNIKPFAVLLSLTAPCPFLTLACCSACPRFHRELMRYACCAPEYRPYLYPRAQSIAIPDTPSPDEDIEHEKYD